MSRVRGRLAPSPTGMAHLGNAWAFLMAWLSVRAQGGELVLRMEDLDQERTSVVYMQALMSDIRWLGLDWDEGPTPEREDAQYHQANRFHLYDGALDALREKGLAYPCFCSRKDLAMLANAPHLGDAGISYPGTCRHLDPDEAARRMEAGKPHSWRFLTEGLEFCFTDLLYGEQRQNLSELGGDFNIKRSDGVYAYQLAVSVDDGLMGITEVVRGRDIMPSTGKQLGLMQALGLKAPVYGHLPLLLDETGERLAKRHASLSLEALRTRGVKPERVVGLLACVAGLTDSLKMVHPRELVRGFDISRLPLDDIVLTEAHMRWLEGK